MSKPITSLKIAVLLVPPVQLLDLSAVDLIGSCSKQYLRECRLPQPLIDMGIEDVQIMYVGEDGPLSPPPLSSSPTSTPETKLSKLTSNCSVRLTHSLKSPAVQPGAIDILYIPGPDPTVVVSEPIRQFVRSHAEIPSTTIMSVCTGIYVLGYSGILDNKRVTGPRPLIGMELKNKFPQANWVELRWASDDSGRLWTSGGITNGQDMVAAWMRENLGAGSLADLVCKFADVDDRGQEYGSSKLAEQGWVLWLIARSWIGKFVTA